MGKSVNCRRWAYTVNDMTPEEGAYILRHCQLDGGHSGDCEFSDGSRGAGFVRLYGADGDDEVKANPRWTRVAALPGTYVLRDGAVQAPRVDTENEGFMYVQKHQGQSVAHAIRWEGWAIMNVDAQGDVTRVQLNH